MGALSRTRIGSAVLENRDVTGTWRPALARHRGVSLPKRFDRALSGWTFSKRRPSQPTPGVGHVAQRRCRWWWPPGPASMTTADVIKAQLCAHGFAAAELSCAGSLPDRHQCPARQRSRARVTPDPEVERDLIGLMLDERKLTDRSGSHFLSGCGLDRQVLRAGRRSGGRTADRRTEGRGPRHYSAVSSPGSARSCCVVCCGPSFA